MRQGKPDIKRCEGGSLLPGVRGGGGGGGVFVIVDFKVYLPTGLLKCLLFAFAGVGLCCEQPISFTRFRPASGTLIFITQFAQYLSLLCCRIMFYIIILVVEVEFLKNENSIYFYVENNNFIYHVSRFLFHYIQFISFLTCTQGVCSQLTTQHRPLFSNVNVNYLCTCDISIPNTGCFVFLFFCFGPSEHFSVNLNRFILLTFLLFYGKMTNQLNVTELVNQITNIRGYHTVLFFEDLSSMVMFEVEDSFFVHVSMS